METERRRRPNKLSVETEGRRKLSDLFMEINHLFASSPNAGIVIGSTVMLRRGGGWQPRELQKNLTGNFCVFPRSRSDAFSYDADVSGVTDLEAKRCLVGNL